MTPIASSLSSLLHLPLVQNLGWALLHFVWQGTLIACVTALLLALLRNARPQTRYALACASLLLCLLLPLARLLQGEVGVAAVLPGISPMPAGAGMLATESGALALTANPNAGTDGALMAWSAALSWLVPWLVLLWMLGLGLFSGRMLLGMLWLHRLQRQSGLTQQPQLQSLHAQWQQRIACMASGFGLMRKVQLRLVDELDSPVTAGWWRPVIFVPASLICRMPPDFLEALLAHELAHIKRFDYVVNLIQSTIEMLLFYHPAVWWISRQIRLEREQIADDLAAARLGDTRRLALALQQLDLFQSSINQFAPAANGGVLMSRIKRLIRPEARSLNWKISLPLGGMLLVCSALYSSVQATTPPAPSAPSAPVAVKVVPPVAPVVKVTPPAPPLVQVTPPAPPAPPAPPEPPAQARKARSGAGYALASAGKLSSSGVSAQQEAKARQLQAESGKDALLFEKNGKAFMVTDPALVARVMTTRQEAEKTEQKMAALEAQLMQESKNLEQLSANLSGVQESASQALAAEAEKLGASMAAIGSKQGQLGAEMGRLSATMSSAGSEEERARLREQMAQLRSQMEPLRAEMQQARKALQAEMRRLNADLGPTRKLAEEMREKSRPLRELGRQMSQLGRERARLERESERALEEVIEKSLQEGAAKAL